MIVTILGAGTMGTQLAVLFASHGIETRLWHHKQNVNLEGTLRRLAQLNSRLGLIDKAEVGNIGNSISTGMDMEMCCGADLIIEAVKEDYSIKIDVLSRVSSLASPEAIIATNTSTLSITGLASVTGVPARFIGVHFFNPPLTMKLVEIVKGEYTSDASVSYISAFLERLNKTFVILPETPGFVVNRLLFPMINEAIFMLGDGIAEARTIDNCLKLGLNHPMGPLELADLIGLDVCLSILETLVSETGDSKYRPAPLLKKYVRAGKFGKKSGAGFYTYKHR